jgi:hypothetical protein
MQKYMKIFIYIEIGREKRQKAPLARAVINH